MSAPSICACAQRVDTAPVTFPFLSFTPQNKAIFSFCQDMGRAREHVSQSKLLSSPAGQENCRDGLRVTPPPGPGPNGVWVGLLLNKDHPPEVEKKLAGGFGTPCAPISWRGREMGGGWRKKQPSRNPLHCAFSALVTVCSP